MPGFLKSFSFDNLTFAEIAMGIVILFAIIAFFRGVFKQLLGMVCVLVGAAIGFFVFKSHDTTFAPVLGDSSPRTVLIASITAGVVIWGILRLVMNLLLGTALFGWMAALLGKGGGVGFVGAAASIIPSGVLVWVTAMVARLTGAIGVAEQTQESVRFAPGQEQVETSWFSRLSGTIDPASKLGQFFSTTDPVATNTHQNLACALLIYEDQNAWKLLGENNLTYGITESPQVLGLLARDDIRQMVAKGQFDALLNSEAVAVASTNPSLEGLLEEVDFRPILQATLFEPIPEDIPKARPVRRRGRLVTPNPSN